MPFGQDLAPSMLHPHRGHQEAVARIRCLVDERALGVLTGEVGCGKTVAARAATVALDSSRHTVIYLGNPAVGTRGVYAAIVTSLGGVPKSHKAALIPQAQEAFAAEKEERGSGSRSSSPRSPSALQPVVSGSVAAVLIGQQVDDQVAIAHRVMGDGELEHEAGTDASQRPSARRRLPVACGSDFPSGCLQASRKTWQPGHAAAPNRRVRTPRAAAR